MKKLILLTSALLSGCIIKVPPIPDCDRYRECPSYVDCPYLIGAIKPSKEQIENARERGWPIPVYKTSPIYPQVALEQKIEGYVIVEYDVNQYGEPFNIRIAESIPEGIFEESAIQSTKNYKYEPTTQEFKDRKTKINFTLDET
ncbi:energy transducer TonB [Microbulbifer sp. 2201CG32-9]|uniref:energy transducer TonB n=1 Tax=Microbulbifer sp. 2201CG32-9 TaxID=3232309 RepID=UPI00345C3AAD